MQIFIDLEQQVVKPLFYAGTQTNGNGTAQDLSAANGPSTNLLLNVGTCVGDATVVVQESDDQATWSALHTFSITAGAGRSLTPKRLLRSKQYLRGVASGITASVQFGLTVVAQPTGMDLGYSLAPQS